MWRRRIILAYLALLAASSLTRWLGSDAPGLAPGQVAFEVPEIDRGKRTGRTVRLACRDFPSREPGAPVIVALHGSPGTSTQVMALARQLAGDFRVIAPDLPGFGHSTRAIADYSIDAHGHYLALLLDELGIERAHLLGFSLGGGIALEFAEAAPARAASIVLIASIGVQELEVLGDFTLNHALHAFQFALLWIVQNAIPHFGALDGGMFDLAYARSFLDSDQRPLRGVLQSLPMPVLILHGERDFLVPVSAAREHARIVPQSELVLFEDGHFRIFRDPASLASPIADFVDRAEAGSARTREQAAPGRVAASRVPFDWRTHGNPRPISVPLMGALLAMATWVTEDLICISAGILASRGALPLAVAVLACFVGIFSGDYLLYLAGRAFGRKALRHAPFRWLISESQVERSAHFFHAHGASLILTTRFVPGTRLPTYFTAGLLGIGFWRFSGWFLLSTALWVPLVVGLSSLVGGRMLDWFERYEKFTFVLLLIVILGLLLMLKVLAPLTNHRGRRLLLSRWRRWTRWEFWPAWIVYPPVVLYILWLGLRHRNLTLFTAVNPAIPGGGLVGESKSAILAGFGGGRPEIAAFRLIPRGLSPAEKLEALGAFLRDERLPWPVVLKPDTGERGQGVAVIADRDAARDYLDRCPHDVIAQEHVPGVEFGIFYARHPDERDGRIISITDKRLIDVTGDGARTIEELILDDDRAVCMAPLFLRRFASRLDEIPATGEKVQLTFLGTHCRGALFLDGAAIGSPELCAAIDALSKRFEGFYFGRYDIRAPSAAALSAGSGFKILELNGVTSEATHIYDPRYGWGRGVRTLMKQWKMAFDIAAGNAQNGAVSASIREVISLIQRFRHRKRFEA